MTFKTYRLQNIKGLEDLDLRIWRLQISCFHQREDKQKYRSGFTTAKPRIPEESKMLVLLHKIHDSSFVFLHTNGTFCELNLHVIGQ